MTTEKKSAALSLADSRILIAGAASLVGSHTADALLAAGAKEVILLDNFAFGTPEAIAHLQDNPRVKVVRGDLMRLPDLLAATEGVDGVLHLAAYMTLGFSQTPWQAVDVNVRGAQNKPSPSSRELNRTGYGIGYDPATGDAGGSGGMPEIVLGSTGGQADLLGSDSWKALILGPVTGK